MAHAQKPVFVFRPNGRVHLNRRGGGSVQSNTGRRAVHISVQGLYCSCKPVFCSHVTLTGCPLYSRVSPSLLLPCVTVCHHISNAVYNHYISISRWPRCLKRRSAAACLLGLWLRIPAGAWISVSYECCVFS